MHQKNYPKFLERPQKTLVVKSYFSKVAGFYRSSHWRCSVKKVFLERCLQNSHENTCVTDSILVKLLTKGSKKETLAQVFSFEFSKISKNIFFTEHLQTTVSTFSLSEAASRSFLLKKDTPKNFAKFTGKHLWFAKFSRAPFYRTPLGDCFWLFPATIQKWGTSDSV